MKSWSGKPTINTSLETSHVMTERTPVIIDASNEFFHYKGGISYAIESEDAEYVTVTETDKKFKVETTIPNPTRRNQTAPEGIERLRRSIESAYHRV